MTNVLLSVSAFLGRNWLRVLIVGAALVMVSKKQVNLNVRLGGGGSIEKPTMLAPLRKDDGDTSVPIHEAAADEEQPSSLLSSLFSGFSTADERLDEPVNREARVIPKAKKGFLERFSLFGSAGSEDSLYDLLALTDDETVAAYVRRFSHVAQAEQKKFGIPASIVLANGLLHTRSGKSSGATNLNNYFGIRCDQGWSGDVQRMGDKCLRQYETAWVSFRDHSLYITSGKFEPMTQFNDKDYRKWAAGLEELGFNATEDLATQLLHTIDRYQLFRFD